MEIELIPADPAQNYTIFVTTPVEPQLRPRVAAALLARQNPPAEQVAFITAHAPLPRMEMMGGEFCGNASRSFGLLWALEHKLPAGSVTVGVSGCSRPLAVQVDPSAHAARVEMPLHTGLGRVSAAGHTLPVFVFEGMCHAVAQLPPSPALAGAILDAMEAAFCCDAFGVVFLGQQPLAITPVVRVPATQSTVWEHSCGSGSLAAALHLALAAPFAGARRFAIAQPGGLLEVDLEMQAGCVTAAHLGGPVHIGPRQTVEIDDEQLKTEN